MTTYALIFNNDGTMHSTNVYKDAEIPLVELLPPDCRLVTFDETDANFTFLYAYFVEDPDRITNDYMPQSYGGATYDFETNTFTFAPRPPEPSLIDRIRFERNLKIAETDDLVYVPDYPAGYMDQILAYRAALRDITDNIDPAWSDIIHVVWPTKPHFI
jgi:hypothetical protein